MERKYNRALGNGWKMDELFFNGYSVSPWAKVVEIVLWFYNTVNVLHAIELYIFKNDSDQACPVVNTYSHCRGHGSDPWSGN